MDTQWGLIVANIALIVTNTSVVVMACLHYRRVGRQLKQTEKHFKKSQIGFERSVQIQRRNQAESDVTQLRMKKAEFLLMPGAERKKLEWKEAMKEIDYRLNQYKECRIPEIENIINQLKKKEEKLGDCGK